MGIDDLIEGISWCDYGAPDEEWTCKPDPKSFAKAMKEAGQSDPSKCYLVDDTIVNCVTATKLGWAASIYVMNDMDREEDVKDVGNVQIRNIYELSDALPQFWMASRA